MFEIPQNDKYYYSCFAALKESLPVERFLE
jgi:hypothetical protein